MEKTLARAISDTLSALVNCKASGNEEWTLKHTETLRNLCQMLPHGSGIDSTVPEAYHGLDLAKSTPDKLVINCSFHHMREGMYDGWTDHHIIVTPAFSGIYIRVTGRDRAEIKDYLTVTYHDALSKVIYH